MTINVIDVKGIFICSSEIFLYGCVNFWYGWNIYFKSSHTPSMMKEKRSSVRHHIWPWRIILMIFKVIFILSNKRVLLKPFYKDWNMYWSEKFNTLLETNVSISASLEVNASSSAFCLLTVCFATGTKKDQDMSLSFPWKSQFYLLIMIACM